GRAKKGHPARSHRRRPNRNRSPARKRTSPTPKTEPHTRSTGSTSRARTRGGKLEGATGGALQVPVVSESSRSSGAAGGAEEIPDGGPVRPPPRARACAWRRGPPDGSP